MVYYLYILKGMETIKTLTFVDIFDARDTAEFYEKHGFNTHLV